jgi:hypothetical protein
VALRIDLNGDGDATTKSLTSAYAVEVDGKWRWVLSPAEVEAFRNGDCP